VSTHASVGRRPRPPCGWACIARIRSRSRARSQVGCGWRPPAMRGWAEQFFAETGATSSGNDEIGTRINAGLLVVWEVDDALVSMAATTVAQGGLRRVHFVYTLTGTAGEASPAPASHH
jgi:hypothetical protein